MQRKKRGTKWHPWIFGYMIIDMHGHRLCLSLVLVSWLGMIGCTAFGPKRLPADRFNYNEAIAQSWDEQMLLNLVRLRYLRMPTFLDVSSVLTQYTYTGNVGARGSGGLDQDLPTVLFGGSVGLGYTERPTITYAPLMGDDFARRLFKPLPVDLIFSLSQAGWSMDQLLPISIQRLNRLTNMSFALTTSSEDIERLRTFQRVTALLQVLLERNAIEFQLGDVERVRDTFLVFEPAQGGETKALIDELQGLLDLAPQRDVYRLTRRVIRRKPHEISVQTRSILAIMMFLARGVEVPEAHRQDGRTWALVSLEDEVLYDVFFPLRVRVSAKRPEDVFLAVQYQDHWFLIEHGDYESQRAFALLTALFRLQTPASTAATPILSLPTGP